MNYNFKIHIGASGWFYNDWSDGVFYPPDINNREWLKFYSSRFSTVEINASFYRQMSVKTYKKWHDIVPDNFIFSVKISRFLTHIKKLNDPKEPWQRFINNAKMLKEKLGPILVQLPPNFKVNCERLENFLKIVKRYKITDSSQAVRQSRSVNRSSPFWIPNQVGNDKQIKIAFEFRHETWFCGKVYKILKKHNAALVFADFKDMPVTEEITADFIYVRMHGPAGLYSSKYTAGQLQKLADKINRWKKEAKEIYVYFNNDTEGYAVENARTLIKLAR